MKNKTKLIVIVTMIALLMCAVISLAIADEKIYTSPTFKLPADQLMEWVEEQPEGEASEEGTLEEGTPEEGTPEEGEPEEGEPEEERSEDGSVEDETVTPAETEAVGEEGQVVGETKEPDRSVTIRSSQGDVVTEGEMIYLTSKLKGFDGLDIAYQWQVDRGDGQGWVDVEGANRPKHMFVADRETIQYSWRLVVNVLDGE